MATKAKSDSKPRGPSPRPLFESLPKLDVFQVQPGEEYTIILTARQWVRNPASTKWDLVGPGKIVVRKYPDGGIEAVILEGCRPRLRD